MEEFVQQHAAVAVSLIGTLLTLLAMMALKVLKQIDTNQTKLTQKLDAEIKEINGRIAALEKDFYRLQGEHYEAIHQNRHGK